jgi:hypothetical protein
MELKSALKEQYHAGFAMLRDCVEKCPDELWTSGEHPRYFWRIAFHAAYFTHLYLVQNEDAFEPWHECPKGKHEEIWQLSADVEPYELPVGAEAFSQQETLAYISYVDRLFDPTIELLNLDSDESGFHWYPNMSKLSHELLNLRHLQGHVGQLSELLMAQGIDTRWISKG